MGVRVRVRVLMRVRVPSAAVVAVPIETNTTARPNAAVSLAVVPMSMPVRMLLLVRRVGLQRAGTLPFSSQCAGIRSFEVHANRAAGDQPPLGRSAAGSLGLMAAVPMPILMLVAFLLVRDALAALATRALGCCSSRR